MIKNKDEEFKKFVDYKLKTKSRQWERDKQTISFRLLPDVYKDLVDVIGKKLGTTMFFEDILNNGFFEEELTPEFSKNIKTAVKQLKQCNKLHKKTIWIKNDIYYQAKKLAEKYGIPIATFCSAVCVRYWNMFVKENIKTEGAIRVSNLQVFKNEEFGEVRTVVIDNEPWFVGKDVAEILGYSNSSAAINRHVDTDDKKLFYFLASQNVTPESNNNSVTIVNESGLYSLILSSKKPEAKKFKRWVTLEVLPSLRKYGMYAVDDLLNNPDLAIRVLTALKEEREKVKRLEIESTNQTQAIAEMKPKVSYYDMILRSKELMTITQIAKDYGLSGRKFNKLLCTHKIQFKQAGQWYLYQKYAQRGYTQSKTYMYKASNNMPHSKLLTCWTQEGRKFLYWFLRDLGIYPVVEQNTQQIIG